MMVYRKYALALILGFISLLVSCQQQTTQQIPPDAVKISGAGATFPAPLYQKWIEEYEKAHQDVFISYDAVGSGEGIDQFIKNQVDFGASDAAMNDEQIAKVERGVQLVPATAGSIVLAYNLKGLNGPLKLNRDVYVDIFAGKINKWNDPRIKASNPELNLPSANIVPVTRLDSSGTTFAFTNHLSAVSKEWRDRGPGVGKLIDWPRSAMAVRGNEGVASRVKISDGAIGYVEYSHAERAGLPMAWLENRAGQFVEPLPSSGESTLINNQDQMPADLRIFFPDPPGEGSYPIVTYSWLLLYRDYPNKEKGHALKEFVKWALADGQNYSETKGYIRLPEKVVQMGLHAVNQIQ